MYIFLTPPFTPENQHELVIHTLCEFIGTEILSNSYWSEHYKTLKFSTRLGEVERMLNLKLAERKLKPFTNRFGHKSQYMTYIPILTREKYVECLEMLREKSNFVENKNQ